MRVQDRNSGNLILLWYFIEWAWLAMYIVVD